MVDYRNAEIRDVIHIFFLLDNSGSMSVNSAIQTLNEAMVNVLNALGTEANKKEVTVKAHILSFSTSIKWLCGTNAIEGVDVKKIVWDDIFTEGNTNTAGAIRAVLPGLSMRYIGHHAYRPIIVLITDGYSDNRSETKKAIEELNLRQKTINVAVGVAGYNDVELDDFASKGTVIKHDGLGNELSANVQKLVFPVAEADQLAGIIKDVAISSMISSIVIAKATENDEAADDDDDTALPVIDLTDTKAEPAPAPVTDTDANNGDTGWL